MFHLIYTSLRMKRDSEPFNHPKSWLVQHQAGKELDMTRYAALKTVSTLTALALTVMLATSAWANDPVYRINDRNSSIDQASVSVLTSGSDAVAPLSAVTLRERRFTKGQAIASLYREISQYIRIGLSDQVLAEIGLAVGD